MGRRKIIVLSVLVSFLFVHPVFAQTKSACEKLTRNLKVGAEGADVKVLQQILNKNKATRVADTGPGSPGNESEYFGKRTTAAMIRFQELYKSEVLTPAGISKGTGFVGTFSRAKLKLLCTSGGTSSKKGGTTSSTKEASGTQANPTATNDSARPDDIFGDTVREPQKPNVFVPMKITKPWIGDGNTPTPEVAIVSDVVMRPGDIFTVYGVGFTGDTPNTLHFGDTYSISNLGVDETGVITFTVPKDVPRGRHFIWVSNRKGKSSRGDVFVVVPTPRREGPNVRIGKPSAGRTGDVVTLYGSGFSTTWNDIYFPTNIVRGVKSVDGNTLSFVIPKDTFELTPEAEKVMPDIKSAYSVVNDYGVSENIPFTVQY